MTAVILALAAVFVLVGSLLSGDFAKTRKTKVKSKKHIA